MVRLLPLLMAVSCAADPDRERRSRPVHGADSESTATAVGPMLDVAAPVPCSDPDARQTIAWDRWEDPAWVNQPFTDVTSWALQEGAGVAVADFTGDGDLDVFVCDWSMSRLFVGGPGRTLVDATEDWLPPAGAVIGAAGATAVDLEGDGDLDLVLSRSTYDTQLLVNTGSSFVVGPPLPVDTRTHGVGSSWGDIDGDGDLDGFLSTYGVPPHVPEPNFVLQNQGKLAFTDLSGTFDPLLLVGHTLTGGWHDLEGDGDLDLLVVNDYGNIVLSNQVGWNDGTGSFALDPGVLGLDVPIAGMGLAAQDLDGDGRLDLLMSGWRRMHLLRAASEVLWVDATTASRLPELWTNDTDRRLPWGTVLEDLDNDGDFDAVVAFGYLYDTFGRIENPLDQRSAVLADEGNGELIEVSEAWGFEHRGVTRGVVAADLDRDGWLDLIFQRLDAPPEIYHARCGANAWLEVRLVDPGSPNPFAVGSRIQIEAGGRTFTRRVVAGGTSLASSGPPEVHFGLGDAVRVDRLEVRWPDGELLTFTDLDVRTIVTVTRGHVGEEAR